MAKFQSGDIVTHGGKKLRVVKYHREHDDAREALVQCEYIPEPGALVRTDKDGNAVKEGETFAEHALEKAK